MSKALQGINCIFVLYILLQSFVACADRSSGEKATNSRRISETMPKEVYSFEGEEALTRAEDFSKLKHVVSIRQGIDGLEKLHPALESHGFRKIGPVVGTVEFQIMEIENAFQIIRRWDSSARKFVVEVRVKQNQQANQ